MKSSAPSNSALYSDFLLELEDQPTPETLQKLYHRIDQLEEKLVDQAKLAHCKELEVHREYENQKGHWVLKHLEMKAQLANLKMSHQEKENQWQKDNSNLVRVVKSLFEALQKNEEFVINLLQDLQQELSKEPLSSFQFSCEKRNTLDHHDLDCYGIVCNCLKGTKQCSISNGTSQHHNINDNLGISGSDTKAEKVYQTPSHGIQIKTEYENVVDSIFTPKMSTPDPFIEYKDVLKSIYNTPKSVNIRSRTQDTANHDNELKNRVLMTGDTMNQIDSTTEKLFSAVPRSCTENLISFVKMVGNAQKKVKDYIKQFKENSFNQQIKFNQDVIETLKRVIGCNKPQNDENNCEVSFGDSIKKNQENLSSLKPCKKNNLSCEEKQLMSFLLQESHNKTLDMSLKDLSESLSYFREEKAREESWRMGKKVLENSLGAKRQDSEKQSSSKLIFKKLENLQNSLALSEKEALLCLLMDNIDGNRQLHDVNLDDLLAASNRKDISMLSSVCPLSLNKLPNPSMSSIIDASEAKISEAFCPEIEDQSQAGIKGPLNLEWQNDDMEDCSSLFPVIRKNHTDAFVPITPNTKKGNLPSRMKRLESSHPDIDVDIDLQNVDLGSFVCNNEEGSCQELGTIGLTGLKDILGKGGISPIISKRDLKDQKKMPKFMFPTSVEKEYGRRLGGALDFDGEHVEDFEMKYIKEERDISSEDHSRSPTTEDTRSGEKIKGLDSQRRELFTDSKVEQKGVATNRRIYLEESNRKQKMKFDFHGLKGQEI